MFEKISGWLSGLSWEKWLILAIVIIVGMWFAARYGLFAWVGPWLTQQ